MQRVVLGLSENVVIRADIEREIVARIDSGAITSSIDTTLAKELGLMNIIRHKTIKSASGVESRPIIQIKVSMHGMILEDQFTVADRSHMTYPMLIGQNILKKGRFLIDPLL